MTTDKVLYTDGRDVTVTESCLNVRKNSYAISGITRLTLWTIRAERWPGVLLVLIGTALAVAGWSKLFPADLYFRTDTGLLYANTLAFWGGVLLLVFGILLAALKKDRYAVRIATAEGEKDAVVSKRRDYIAQIVDAVNRAFSLRDAPGSSTVTSARL